MIPDAPADTWSSAEADLSEFPAILDRLYQVVEDLQRIAPGRPFTPDGHLVGSIGEVVAAYAYGLSLGVASTKAHDATAPDGRLVQVKLTQGRRNVQISYCCEHLIAWRLDSELGFEEVYNGPGLSIWDEIRHKADVGRQRPISLTRLRELNRSVLGSGLTQVRPFPILSRKARAAVAEI